MKLSQREQILLIILAFIVVVFGSYFLLLKPQFEKINTLKTEEETLQAKYDEFVVGMDPKHPVYKQRTIADTKVKELTSLFFPELRQEKFILLLGEQMEVAGIKPQDVSFTNIESGANLKEAETTTVKEEKTVDIKILEEMLSTYYGIKAEKPIDTEALKAENEEIKKLMNSVQRQSLTLNYSGDIFSLLLFLNELESYSRRIVVEKVEMHSTGLGQQQSSVQLTYYAIPKLHKQDDDFMSWNLIGPYGKADPFYGSFAPIGMKAKGQGPEKSATKADFFMMLNPISSDLTTVIMSKMNDRLRETYLYGDNEGQEMVNIELTEKDGKYYYTYQVGADKYPKEIEPAVFVPNGDTIKVQVMSSPRNGTKDLSGVKVTVVNKTSKALVFEVYNDDAKSRLQLVKTSGNVSIVKR